MAIERVEVYLDGASEPLQVLKSAPFKIRLDTRGLPDGQHTLRVVTFFRNGTQEVKEIPFEVNNFPGVTVEGLEPGSSVSGEVEISLRVGDPEIPPSKERFPTLPTVLFTVVLLLLVWGFFAITKVPNKVLTEVAPAQQEASASSSAVAAAPASSSASPAIKVDPALYKAGESLFNANCSACHQTNGQGIPGAFPPLAGNPALADAALVITTVLHGHHGQLTVNGTTYNGVMPAVGASWSDKQVAEVATYVRNSWGNHFGGVDPAEVAAVKAGKPLTAAAPSSSSSSSSSSPMASSSSAMASTPVSQALYKEGESLFNANCSACHQTNGQGIPGAFPPLAGNSHLTDASLIIEAVHNGKQGQITVNGTSYNGAMPPIGASWSDEQIAAVATYVRNTWGNKFGGVSPTQVKSVLGQ
jgi:cytochrome c oxidase subunit 2